MAKHPPLTAAAIDAIAAAIFAEPGAQVLEAYSAFDEEPRQFASAQELASYAKEKISKPQRSCLRLRALP